MSHQRNFHQQWDPSLTLTWQQPCKKDVVINVLVGLLIKAKSLQKVSKANQKQQFPDPMQESSMVLNTKPCNAQFISCQYSTTEVFENIFPTLETKATLWIQAELNLHEWNLIYLSILFSTHHTAMHYPWPCTCMYTTLCYSLTEVYYKTMSLFLQSMDVAYPSSSNQLIFMPL